MATNVLGEFNYLIHEELKNNEFCYFRLKIERKSGKLKYTQYIKIDKKFNVFTNAVLDNTSIQTYICRFKSQIKYSSFFSNYSSHYKSGNLIKINKLEYDIIDKIAINKQSNKPFRIYKNDLKPKSILAY